MESHQSWARHRRTQRERAGAVAWIRLKYGVISGARLGERRRHTSWRWTSWSPARLVRAWRRSSGYCGGASRYWIRRIKPIRCRCNWWIWWEWWQRRERRERRERARNFWWVRGGQKWYRRRKVQRRWRKAAKRLAIGRLGRYGLSWDPVRRLVW